MTVAVVTEKPAVARDIAKVLGASKRAEGSLEGHGYRITWGYGHLVALAMPHEIRSEWRSWRRETLPMIPERWPLVVGERNRAQFEVVRDVINAPDVERVVCATDAGREGELIFRLIYEAAGCTKPVSRLWLSSLTPNAIRKGFEGLRDGREFEPLADAARGRSRADWLVGLNLSRAMTLAHDEKLTIGRVQTPTLAMLAERELAIQRFVPEDYLEVVATFALEGEQGVADEAGEQLYTGTWFKGDKPSAEARRLPPDGAEAESVVARVLSGRALVERRKDESRRLQPPLLYDLTELQRHANRLYGFSAVRTLEIAQQLYERHKLLTYPRTDSRHLSAEVAATLDEVCAAIAAPYEEQLAEGTGERPLGRRFVDDKRVSDHHAIIPTTARPAGVSLNTDEHRIYDLVCRRLLAAWHDDHIWSVTTVVTVVRAPAVDADTEAPLDRFHSSGTVIEQMGWKVLEHDASEQDRNRARTAKRPGGEADSSGAPERQSLPAGLAADVPVDVRDARTRAGKTRPPRRLTDATLLTAMETAGKVLDDKALSEAMRESGLGTPATRAEIIENLIRRDYVVRERKAFTVTEKGIRLVALAHPKVKSPALTGEWEAALHRIQQGREDLGGFMQGIEKLVRELVAAVLAGDAAPPRPSPAANGPPPVREHESSANEVSATETPPVSGDPVAGHPSLPGLERASFRSPAPVEPGEKVSGRVDALLREPFGLQAFRPYQEAACNAAADGEDVLLVMPTGAGKSLCYQLPGLARGGPTLVISPLIALMEDQVAKLQALGLRAERIHSGRDRLASRRVCAAYLARELDYLFIAPERLSVPGFPEFLGRLTPGLVAVDEAHCISHWGHDFRPDYRLLGERLPLLRPAPVISLTATATPRVQDDIAEQLGMPEARRIIAGFRRTNIAVEVVSMPQPERADAVRRILAEPERRPAIVYAPTRKDAESLANGLAREMRAAAYHAGMPNQERSRVQSAFQDGALEVIVATIAFGMGIDKPDVRTVVHTGLSGSLESYYQEIGRAGRDGQPSRAVLLFSYADRRLQEFFHERDYPDPAVLQRVFETADSEPQPGEMLREGLRMEPKLYEAAIAKLWGHGGVRIVHDPVSGEELVIRGAEVWAAPYQAQRAFKAAQLQRMYRWAEGTACRMRALVRHFGDQADSGEPCGQCDVCAPEACLVRAFRGATDAERDLAARILERLRARGYAAAGRLHGEIEADCRVSRDEFRVIVEGLSRGGFIEVSEEVFEKDGRSIPYQRLSLTAIGKTVEPGSLEALRLTAPIAGSSPPTARRRQRKRRGDNGGEGRKVDNERPSPTDAPPAMVAALKQWRLAEARGRSIPAFRILTDRTLLGIAASHPADEAGLLRVHGVGPGIVDQYGEQILAILSAKS